MSSISARVMDDLAHRGVTAIHEPVLGLIEGGRLDFTSLPPVMRSFVFWPISNYTGMVRLVYCRRIRPAQPSLFVDGQVLGAAVPLGGGSWCVVENYAIAVHIAHGLPDTIVAAAKGRRIGQLIDIEGLTSMPYRIRRIQRSTGSSGTVVDIVRAPVTAVTLASLG